MSQQSITSFGSQETDAKMAKVIYDYAVSCDIISRRQALGLKFTTPPLKNDLSYQN
jgi:hypothetical protein